MAEYWSDEDITREYVVGTERLLTFAQRGNLPMRREGDVRFYDVAVVAQLFRRRDAAEGAQGMTLGGGFCLGNTLEPPSSTDAFGDDAFGEPRTRLRKVRNSGVVQRVERVGRKVDVA